MVDILQSTWPIVIHILKYYSEWTVPVGYFTVIIISFSALSQKSLWWRMPTKQQIETPLNVHNTHGSTIV